jgi:DivIVA domain-containing protein
MVWFIVLLAVAIIALAVLAGTGRLGSMPPQVQDRPGPDLPEGPLSAEDLRLVRFAAVPRGYAMDQVDVVLDRMADQLDGLDPEQFKTASASSAEPEASVYQRPVSATVEPSDAESEQTGQFTPRRTGLGWPAQMN